MACARSVGGRGWGAAAHVRAGSRRISGRPKRASFRMARRPRAQSHPCHGVEADPPPHPTYDMDAVIRLALAEDAGDLGDVTTVSTVCADREARATCLAKGDGTLAGLRVADAVFRAVDEDLVCKWTARDGDAVARGQVFGVLTGRARSVLVAERVALNFMQRMGGIATLTGAYVDAVKKSGASAKILETRKTAPGLRVFDKWAVLIGGGTNHRIGLYDMVMIKDNHIAAAGGIEKAVASCRDYLSAQGRSVPIEVEVCTLAQLDEVLAIQPPVDRIMLDNMTVRTPDGGLDTSMLYEAVARVAGRVETEASGNVTLDTVAQIALSGCTYISSGQLTHSVQVLDISMNIDT